MSDDDAVRQNGESEAEHVSERSSRGYAVLDSLLCTRTWEASNGYFHALRVTDEGPNVADAGSNVVELLDRKSVV